MTSYRHDGADPQFGRRLPHLFRRAGLADIGVEARTDVYPAGHPQRTVLADLLRAMRPKIAARGLATGPELDALDAAARRHLANPDTLAVPVAYFLTWARNYGQNPNCESTPAVAGCSASRTGVTPSPGEPHANQRPRAIPAQTAHQLATLDGPPTGG